MFYANLTWNHQITYSFIAHYHGLYGDGGSMFGTSNGWPLDSCAMLSLNG